MTELVPTSRDLVKLVAGAITLAVAGCATPIGPNSVSSCAVGHASTVRPATVTSVRAVTIQGQDQHGIGTGAGAVVGGLLGSQVGGRNSTQAIGAVGGAVLGGLAGNAATKAATTSNGYAYIVRFDNGESREIVQGPGVAFPAGTPVNIAFRCDGAVISQA